MQPIEQAFQGFPPIGQQMPTVRYLSSLRSAFANTPGIFRRTVSCNDLDAWMRFQPRRDRIGRSLANQVHRPMSFPIHEQGAVNLPLAEGEIVKAQHAWRRQTWRCIVTN